MGPNLHAALRCSSLTVEASNYKAVLFANGVVGLRRRMLRSQIKDSNIRMLAHSPCGTMS